MPRTIGREARLDYPSFAKIGRVSWLYIALLALAVAVVAGAEWPRLGAGLETRLGVDAHLGTADALRGGDVDVARAGDHVDRRKLSPVGVGAAIGQQRDGLRTADRPHLADAE